MTKQISIIIPCYNVDSYIDRCFASLAAQTIGIENLEIILVDDCSTDGTWEKLQELETRYPNSVIIIHCDENGRQGRARNIGMEYASAPYIGFVDADDWVEQDMFQILYEQIRRQNCDVAMCRNYRDPAEPGQTLPSRRTGQEDRCLEITTTDQRRMFLACGSIGYGVWDKLYRTHLLRENQITFPEGIAYEDHYFSILSYFYVHRVCMIEERLYHYFVNNQSTVLAPDAGYHFDILTADCMWWEECEKRGFLREYRRELEYQFLSLCYLASFKMMLLRLSKAPYDYFVHLKKETLKKVPDYHKNQCVKELVTETNQVLLELLDRHVTETQFEEICTLLRGYIKQGKLAI